MYKHIAALSLLLVGLLGQVGSEQQSPSLRPDDIVVVIPTSTQRHKLATVGSRAYRKITSGWHLRAVLVTNVSNPVDLEKLNAEGKTFNEVGTAKASCAGPLLANMHGLFHLEVKAPGACAFLMPSSLAELCILSRWGLPELQQSRSLRQGGACIVWAFAGSGSAFPRVMMPLSCR